MIEREAIRTRTAALPAVVTVVWHWLRRCGTRAKRLTVVVLTWVAGIARGPGKRLLLGRHMGVSIATSLGAVVVVPVVAWWVATTTGYPPIETLVTETWRGTNPHLIVFLVTGLLVGFGTVSAAVNSGFIPTHLLVSAPLFGVALTRYGTEYSYATGEVATVSVPDAVAFATAVGLLGTIPITLAGFVLGEVVGRGVRRLDVSISEGFDLIDR